MLYPRVLHRHINIIVVRPPSALCILYFVGGPGVGVSLSKVVLRTPYSIVYGVPCCDHVCSRPPIIIQYFRSCRTSLMALPEDLQLLINFMPVNEG